MDGIWGARHLGSREWALARSLRLAMLGCEDRVRRVMGEEPLAFQGAFARHGEMGARVREFDWAETSLGPIGSWPLCLQTAVGICLNSPIPMFVWWGPDLVNIYNDGCLPILGDLHPTALGQSARELWAELWPVIGDDVQRALESGVPIFRRRQRFVLRRGGRYEETFFTYSQSPIPDEGGRIGGLFQVCQDETQAVLAERERDREAARRRRADEGARMERENMAGLIERAPALICVLHGPEHVFELTNDRYDELVGGRDLIGKRIREALPEVEGQGFFEALDRVYATGEPFVGNEVSLALASGPQGEVVGRVVNFVYQPLRDADGRVDGIVAHGVDVTDLVRSRESLREGEERERRAAADALVAAEANAKFRAFFDQGTYFASVMTLDGTVIEANRMSLEACGFERSDVIGRKFWDCGWWSPSPVLAGTIREDARMAARGETVRRETPYFVADGSERYVDLTLAPVRDEQGKVLFIAPTGTDITDMKRFSDERERLLDDERYARAEAERVGRMQDEFLATLSHELRTPLNAILGWAQMLAERRVEADVAQRGLDAISRNARSQAQLIEDLLDMSRIISGKVRLEIERMDLGSVIEAAVDVVRPTADAKGVRLERAVDPAAALITGDAARLQQVLWNLLSNAIKFTPADGLVRVTLGASASGVELRVSDTGQGIRPEFLPHVFDRFSQADATTTRQQGGLGLGLSIVRSLVEMHGGRIRAESAGIDRGATFRIELPRVAAERGQACAPSVRRPERAPGAVERWESPPLVGIRVLAVDDDADARDLVRHVLESAGAVVVTAAGAGEALSLLRENVPHLILSDIGMPETDGYAFMRRLRALPVEQGGHVPAVALTAFARSEERRRALQAGYQVHVAKPVEPAELVAVCASLVEGTRSAAARGAASDASRSYS